MTPAVRSLEAIAKAENLLRSELERLEGEILSARGVERLRTADVQDLRYLETSRQAMRSGLAALEREREFANLRDELAEHPEVARVSWSLDWVASGRAAGLSPVGMRLDLQTRDLSFHRVTVQRDVPAAALRSSILKMLDGRDV